MAAKGSQAKQEITNKILEYFNGSFLNNDGKEIRIPFIENNEEVQIKITLTCAKENIIQGSDNRLPGETIKNDNVINIDNSNIDLSKQEQEDIMKFAKMLDL